MSSRPASPSKSKRSVDEDDQRRRRGDAAPIVAPLPPGRAGRRPMNGQWQPVDAERGVATSPPPSRPPEPVAEDFEPFYDHEPIEQPQAAMAAGC